MGGIFCLRQKIPPIPSASRVAKQAYLLHPGSSNSPAEMQQDNIILLNHQLFDRLPVTICQPAAVNAGRQRRRQLNKLPLLPAAGL